MNLFDNPNGNPENDYIVFYKNPNGGKGKRCQVRAISTQQAREKGAVMFKAKSVYDVIVVRSSGTI